MSFDARSNPIRDQPIALPLSVFGGVVKRYYMADETEAAMPFAHTFVSRHELWCGHGTRRSSA